MKYFMVCICSILLMGCATSPTPQPVTEETPWPLSPVLLSPVQPASPLPSPTSLPSPSPTPTITPIPISEEYIKPTPAAAKIITWWSGYKMKVEGGITPEARDCIATEEACYLFIGFSQAQTILLREALAVKGVKHIIFSGGSGYIAIVPPTALPLLEEYEASGLLWMADIIKPEYKLESDLAEKLESMALDEEIQVTVVGFEEFTITQRNELAQWMKLKNANSEFIGRLEGGFVSKQNINNLLLLPYVRSVNEAKFGGFESW